MTTQAELLALVTCTACGKATAALACVEEFCIECYSDAVGEILREQALSRLRRKVADARWTEFQHLAQGHPERQAAHARWREATERCAL